MARARKAIEREVSSQTASSSTLHVQHPVVLRCRGFPFLLPLWCASFSPQALVEELDSKISALTDEMYEEGIDAATVARIVKDKEAAEERSAKLYAEVRASYPRGCYLCWHQPR